MDNDKILKTLTNLIRPKQINHGDHTKSLFNCPGCKFYYTYDSFEPGVPVNVNEYEKFCQHKNSLRYNYIIECSMGISRKMYRMGK